jgi:tripartite-type tricarboxylate transporter receptor subunit TctC
MKRREFLSLLGGAVAAWPHGAEAQTTPPTIARNWPQRLVRIVVPFVPGGGTDAVARILAAGLSKSAGYQIVIENKGGGSTNIGTEAVAHAAPDGYTVLFCSLPFAINRFLFSTLGYDSFTDFAPVTLIATYPDLMAVPTPRRPDGRRIHPLCQGQRRQDDVRVVRHRHLSPSRRRAVQAPGRHRMTHIPYRGAGPAMTDVIGGRVDVTFNTFGATLSLVRDGQVRGLAVTSAKRFAAAPELPTVAEVALPGFDVTAWYALYVPAQTPPEIIRKLNADVVAVLGEPAIRDKMELLGVAVVGSSPEELGRHLKSETELGGRIRRQHPGRVKVPVIAGRGSRGAVPHDKFSSRVVIMTALSGGGSERAAAAASPTSSKRCNRTTSVASGGQNSTLHGVVFRKMNSPPRRRPRSGRRHCSIRMPRAAPAYGPAPGRRPARGACSSRSAR